MRGLAHAGASAARSVTGALKRSESDLTRPQIRARRVGLSSLAMALGRGSQIGVSLITLPLLLAHLGPERFGLLMTLVGFTSWFLLDVGIGEGVKLRLIECFARDDRRMARVYVSTGLVGLVTFALVVGVAFACLWRVVPWASVFRAAPAEVEGALAVSVGLALAAIPLKILREIYTAEQRGYAHSLWSALGALLVLPAVALAVLWDAGLVGCVLALQGSIVLVTGISALRLFGRDRRWLAPRLSLASREAWRDMAADSRMLLLLGLAMMVLNGTDVFVANHVLGGEAAGVLAFSLRAMFLFQIVVSFLAYPSWPAIGEAVARGEWDWAARTSRRLLLWALGLGTLFAGVLALAGAPLVEVWSGARLSPPRGLMPLLGLYVLLRVACAVLAILLRAYGRVRNQALACAAEALLHVVLCVAGAKGWGLVGIALGGCVALAATRAWALPLEYVHVLRSARGGRA